MKDGNSSRQIGRIGEEAVCGYLQKLGHTILERNWRTGHLEVDIISMFGDGVHFTEVKTRVAPLSADPSDSIGYRKRTNISKAAAKYVARHIVEVGDAEIWLDAASVVLDGGKTEIEYSAGAYMPLHT